MCDEFEAEVGDGKGEKPSEGDGEELCSEKNRYSYKTANEATKMTRIKASAMRSENRRFDLPNVLVCSRFVLKIRKATNPDTTKITIAAITTSVNVEEDVEVNGEDDAVLALVPSEDSTEEDPKAKTLPFSSAMYR